MRLTIALATLMLSLAGCAGNSATERHPKGQWRVIPLNPAQNTNYPDRTAILVNERTGDTWIYEPRNNRSSATRD